MKVLFEDSSLLVVYKSAGLKVYRDSKDEPESLTDLLQEEVTSGEPVFPVHRLDSPTCGLVVFAKNAKVANLLQKKFQEGQIEKTYVAIVHGKIEADRGKISRPLKHPKTKQLHKAVTEFQVMERVEWKGEFFTVLTVQPLTGRFHQIRKHLDGEGHTIVGDPTYGKPKARSKKSEPAFEKSNPFRRMALSAIQVDFIHPVSRRRIYLTEIPPDEFGKWIRHASKK